MIEEPPLIRINTKRNRPTAEQIAAFQGVPTSFVCDAMDGKGALAGLAPIGFGRDLNCVAAGPALTAENGPADLLATLCAIKFVEKGDVMISSVAGHQGCAAAGDRVCGFFRNAGAAGFVTDGPMRDYAGIVDVGLPAWCTGLNPASPFGKGPGTVGFPVQIAGQTVASGDMIVADRDGVVVVPFANIDAVIERLKAVTAAEMALDAEVRDGLVIPPSIEALLASDQVSYE
ncbi:RraA family protein [Pseudoprimorskyibacter insulae]|uniref:Putative 4-hydroxy-4-methyl-2-oxoglutarate aldolase n=1 Tax=Pseudoprimorskyibacter insulae TaxID=1695997 RepID=A0A2R8AQA2_9RHOB|nr:RraA family protein [Pseudoprimorskyibacter insulae]SPF78014.1 4-hydroxy-4-methyl-2-oxoglutarate aldolase/4-carboxy-4-hydroxy-2-oxoadipate aldolase [Pseudoprimorskyibacter insulae]